MSPSFAELAPELYADGALRDFYLPHFTASDWDIFLSFAPLHCEAASLTWRGIEMKFPSCWGEIKKLQLEDPVQLSLTIGGGVLCATFSTRKNSNSISGRRIILAKKNGTSW